MFYYLKQTVLLQMCKCEIAVSLYLQSYFNQYNYIWYLQLEHVLARYFDY